MHAYSVALTVSNSCGSMDCRPPGFSVHGISQARILEWVPCSPQGDLPNPENEPSSPVVSALKAESLPLRHLGNPYFSILISKMELSRWR